MIGSSSRKGSSRRRDAAGSRGSSRARLKRTGSSLALRPRSKGSYVRARYGEAKVIRDTNRFPDSALPGDELLAEYWTCVRPTVGLS